MSIGVGRKKKHDECFCLFFETSREALFGVESGVEMGTLEFEVGKKH